MNNRDLSNSLADNSNEDSGDYPDSNSPESPQPMPRNDQGNNLRQSIANNLHPQASGPEPSESSGGNEPNQQGAAGPGADEEEFECPDDGIFADEASGCQSYLVCQSGAQVQQKFQCPLGTLFNNIILTCDFAHNVQCGKGSQKSAASPNGQASDPNDTIRGPPAAPSNQYQQPSSVQNSPNFRQQQQQQYNGPAPRPQYQQLPQPWQQHYPPSTSQQQQQSAAQTQPIALNVRARQQQQQLAGPSADNSSNDDSDDSSDSSDSSEPNRGSSSDYDSPEPLIPASLPNSARQQQQQQQANNYRQQHHASGSSLLPYKAPPAAQFQQYQQPNREFQSAHKSQLRPTNYQVDPSAANYDGASVATPVYAEKPKQNGPSSINSTSEAATDEPSTFNLVINHVTKPTSIATPAKPLQQVTSNNNNNNNYDNNHQQQRQQHAINIKQSALLNNQVQSDHQTPFKPIKNQLTPAIISQHQKTAKQPQQILQRQNSANNSNGHRQKAPSIRPHSANQASNSYQSLASQTKPIHVVSNDGSSSENRQNYNNNNNNNNVNANSMGRPAVIDLTSDKQIGVSSEAMNNGLLLIVRHSPSHNQHQQQQQYSPVNPIGSAVASSSLSTTHVASPSEQYGNVLLGGKYSTSDNGNNDNSDDPSSGSLLLPKAFAVEPSQVQPNSPIDAQLFPNVQNILSNNQPQAILNQKRNQQEQRIATENNKASVHPPLGHLEPPKPTLIETTSHLQNQQQPQLYNRQLESKNQQLTSASSSVEPINLMLADSGSSSGSAFETGNGNNRLIAASDQMATQSSWKATTTTTQATPLKNINNNNNENNRQQQHQQQTVTSNRRLRAAKAPEPINKISKSN